MEDTQSQFDYVVNTCRELFINKLQDYGASWRIMRPMSITDQIFIKAKRIRTIQEVGTAMVDEGIASEFIAIANYGIIGLIQLELGFNDWVDIENEEAIKLYDKYMNSTKELMYAKNHDYGEAWRSLRIFSLTDLILSKIQRTKMIENNKGLTIVSEGVDANYMDMINYALFALIKIKYGDDRQSK